MIHPDVREALEEIQQNLKNEMISAKVLLKEYGDKSGIHAGYIYGIEPFESIVKLLTED